MAPSASCSACSGVRRLSIWGDPPWWACSTADRAARATGRPAAGSGNTVIGETPPAERASPSVMSLRASSRERDLHRGRGTRVRLLFRVACGARYLCLRDSGEELLL